jgi:hypothetical protein
VAGGVGRGHRPGPQLLSSRSRPGAALCCAEAAASGNGLGPQLLSSRWAALRPPATHVWVGCGSKAAANFCNEPPCPMRSGLRCRPAQENPPRRIALENDTANHRCFVYLHSLKPQPSQEPCPRCFFPFPLPCATCTFACMPTFIPHKPAHNNRTNLRGLAAVAAAPI